MSEHYAVPLPFQTRVIESGDPFMDVKLERAPVFSRGQLKKRILNSFSQGSQTLVNIVRSNICIVENISVARKVILQKPLTETFCKFKELINRRVSARVWSLGFG